MRKALLITTVLALVGYVFLFWQAIPALWVIDVEMLGMIFQTIAPLVIVFAFLARALVIVLALISALIGLSLVSGLFKIMKQHRVPKARYFVHFFFILSVFLPIGRFYLVLLDDPNTLVGEFIISCVLSKTV